MPRKRPPGWRRTQRAAKIEKEAEEAERIRKAQEEAAHTRPAKKEVNQAERGEDGFKVKQREHKVPCFHPFDKKKFMEMSAEERRRYLKEMAEQLRRQQDQINNMSTAEYKAARDAFEKYGRNPRADGAQAGLRKEFANAIEQSIAKSLRKGGMSARRAEIEAATSTDSLMSKLAALHEPDMTAGGWTQPNPKHMGRADVNSSIGSSWNQGGRISGIDAAADNAIKRGEGKVKMNVKLEPCRGKGLR